MAADTYDLLTAPEARFAINDLAGSYDTSELEQLVTAASRLCDSVFGPIVTRAFTKTVEKPYGRIQLDVPVGSPTFAVTFTTVTEYTSGTGTLLTAEDADTQGTYRYYANLGVVARRSAWTDTYWASQEVVIVGTWGRYANTAAVDRKFKEAAAAALVHYAQHRGSQSGFGTPGGDGVPFGGVPFSTDTMRKKLAAMMPEEALPSTLGLTVA